MTTPLTAPVAAPPPNLPPVPDAPTAAAPELNENDEQGAAAERAFQEAWKQMKSPDLAGWRTSAKFFALCLVKTPEHERCKEGLALAEGRIKAVNATPPARPSGRTGRHDTNYEE